MPSLHDILDDKTKYPDDSRITLADGVETTLGELRGGHLRDRDYRQKTQALSVERQAFAQEKATFEQSKAAAEQELARLAEQVVTRNAPRAQQQDEWDDYLQTNPVAKRLMDRITAQEERLREYDERTKKAEQELRLHAQTYIADQHRMALARIKQADPKLDEQALVAFAQQNYIPRLDLAYRLMTEGQRHADAVAKVREEASKEAYDKAKRELSQPALPQRRVVSALPQDAPKTFDDAADAAARDPEILAAMEGFIR